MFNNKQAKDIILNDSNFIYSINLHKKFLGNYYYVINYKDKYEITRKASFNSEFKTKDQCLNVLDKYCSLFKKHNFIKVDNVVVNLNEIHDIKYDDVYATVIYTDGKEVGLRATKKQFLNLYAEALTNAEGKER